MKKVPVLLFVSVLILACGGDDDDGNGGHSPEISNLEYSLTSAQVGQGAVTVHVGVDFADQDGDVVFFRFSVQDCGEGPWLHNDLQCGDQLRGKIAGTIWFPAAIGTDCSAESYTARVSAFDGQGHQSNVMEVDVLLDQNGAYQEATSKLPTLGPT